MEKRIVTYAIDLGSMVDEILGGIGVVAEGYLLVHEDCVGEGVEDFGLVVLGRVGFGGFGATEAVVFVGAPAALLDGCRQSGDGESKDGDEN